MTPPPEVRCFSVNKPIQKKKSTARKGGNQRSNTSRKENFTLGRIVNLITRASTGRNFTPVLVHKKKEQHADRSWSSDAYRCTQLGARGTAGAALT